MTFTDNKLSLIITLMAGFMAAVVGLGAPFFYFSLSYSHQDSALRTEVEINSRIVTQLINHNPEMWRYEELRLVELMRRRPGEGTPEIRRVRDLENQVIAESAEHLQAPVLTRRSDLLDSGRKVGTIEILSGAI